MGGGVGPRRASVNAAWLAVSGSGALGERADHAELAEGRSEKRLLVKVFTIFRKVS